MSSPHPITNGERDEATLEGLRRRAEYVKKHPREEVTTIAPTGWDEPMKSKKDKRRNK